MKKICFLALFVFLAGCGTKQDTPSGKPEICIQANGQQVMNVIAQEHRQMGWTLSQGGPGVLVADISAGKPNMFGVDKVSRRTFQVVPQANCARVIMEVYIGHKDAARGSEDLDNITGSKMASDTANKYLQQLNAKFH